MNQNHTQSCMSQELMYIIRIFMNQPEQKLKILQWAKLLFQNRSQIDNPIGIDFPLSDYEWFVCNQIQYHASLFLSGYFTEEGLQQLLADEWSWILNELYPFGFMKSNQFHLSCLWKTFDSIAYQLKKALMLPSLNQRVVVLKNLAYFYQPSISNHLQNFFNHSCLIGKCRLQGNIKSTDKAILKWKTKLEYENFSPNQMYFDILRFRLSVSSVEECYQALELLKKQYRVFRVRDYYQKPKPNGLSFLNMNMIHQGQFSFPFEMQIMTYDMKKVYFDSDDHDRYNEKQYYKKGL